MARTKISEFSATAADNTEIDGIDIAEGCAPSGINNSIRELMSQLKDFQTGAGGDSFTSANLAYTGTLTGGTGVIAIGTNQIYKDVSGNVGIGVTPSAWVAGHKALQFSGNASLSGVGNSTLLAQNYYTNGTTRYIANGFACLYEQNKADGGHKWYIAPSGTADAAISFTQAMTLDTAGNVGIGITNPSQKLYVEGSIVGKSSDNYFGNYPDGAYVDIGNLGTSEMFIETRSNVLANINLNYRAKGLAAHVFNTNNIERMRITDTGSLNLGTVTNPTSSSTGIIQARVTSGDVMNVKHEVDSSNMINLWQTGTTVFAAITFNKGATQTSVGNIACTTTGTAYNTTSDYRLKENVTPMTGALAKVAQLKPITYTWKADGSDGQGFIAHELAEVCPQAVSGVKDAVYENGDPKYQGIDTSYLVATLVSAIQELKAEFDAYKASHP